MGESCPDALCAGMLADPSCSFQRPPCRTNIVDEQDIFILHVSDQSGHFHLFCAYTALINDSEINFQSLGIGPGQFDAADIRRHNDKLVHLLFRQSLYNERTSVKVIDRDVEKPLDLL